MSPPEDLPGFRKILPRATYVVLSKSCSSSDQTGGVQPDLSVGSLGSQVEGGSSSASLPKEPQFTPLGLASEVELAEEFITVDDLEEETAVASHLQGILLSSSSTISSKDPASAVVPTVTHDLQSSTDLIADGVNNAVVEGDAGRAMVQIQGEKTQVVTIIPTQVRQIHPSTRWQCASFTCLRIIK